MARLAAGLAHNFGLSSVTMLHTVSRRDADSEPFVAPLRNATGVWILGGDAEWLLDSYLGTRTERELVALLDRGGVIGGTSAGAVIWGSSLMIFGNRPGAAQPSLMQPDNLIIGDPRGTGIGLLRNVMIAPHYAEFRLDPSLRKTVAVRLCSGAPCSRGAGGTMRATEARNYGDSRCPVDFSQLTNRNPPGDSNGGVLGAGVTWS